MVSLELRPDAGSTPPTDGLPIDWKPAWAGPSMIGCGRGTTVRGVIERAVFSDPAPLRIRDETDGSSDDDGRGGGSAGPTPDGAINPESPVLARPGGAIVGDVASPPRSIVGPVVVGTASVCVGTGVPEIVVPGQGVSVRTLTEKLGSHAPPNSLHSGPTLGTSIKPLR